MTQSVIKNSEIRGQKQRENEKTVQFVDKKDNLNKTIQSFIKLNAI